MMSILHVCRLVRSTLPLAVLLTLPLWTAAAQGDATLGATVADAGPASHPARIVWHSPSKDSTGSMPIGNGDIGANVWVEQNGDLVFYISKTDAWSENCRLLKLGRVRVRLDPPLYAPGATFAQRLNLTNGLIEITSSTENRASSLQFWIDANNPVIHIDAESNAAFSLTASLELWRTKRRQLKGQETHSAYGLHGAGGPDIFVEPDTIVSNIPGRVVWYHRNERSLWADNLKLQALGDLAETEEDPLLHRTFGCLMVGEGLRNVTAVELASEKPARSFSLRIYPLTKQAKTAGEWVDEACRLATSNTGHALSKEEHERWWREFWERSWIRVTPTAQSTGVTMVPPNAHAVHLGMDPHKGNRFVGEIGRATLIGQVLSADEVADLAKVAREHKVPVSGPNVRAMPTAVTGPVADSDSWTFPEGLTVEAWVKPGNLPSGGGRIVDKATPAKADGFVLDTYPGNSLRLITQAGTVTAKRVLPKGKWVHVAGVADPEEGTLSLYVDGRKVAGGKVGHRESDAERVTQAYALQRWVNACSGRGNSPIKFNGSIFTVDGNDKGSWDADYRRWGGPYWWQNTRLAYWNMLSAGDFDLMQPLYRMFVESLHLRKAAARKYYGHDGAFYPETQYFWGTYVDGNYGRDRSKLPDGMTENRFIRYYWQGGLELSLMMLDTYAHTQDEAFAHSTLVPVASEILTFFDQHWKRDEKGCIRFDPAMALETYRVAVNPLVEIVGIRKVCEGMLALPESLTTAQQRAQWKRLIGELPPVPTREVEGAKVLACAESYSGRQNSENPELYAVFPYRRYGLGKPDLELASRTYTHRAVKRTGGWSQDAIKAAYLGLADEAKNMVVANASRTASGYRFPAMWGPNFDWIPDQDHGCVMMIALQRMLLQCDGDEIRVIPAWPKDWDVKFKLHAPKRTIVEGEYRNGKVVKLEVTPDERNKDVVVAKGRG